MSSITKIAISLPQELLIAAEEERRRLGTSRSEFFRQAIAAYIRQAREREAIERYVRGYQEQPETPQEIAEADASARLALTREVWE